MLNSLPRHPKSTRRRHSWRAAIPPLVLLASVLAGCAPTAAVSVSPASGLSTPVPPAALATIPPAKPARAPDTTGGPTVGVENFNYTPADLTVPAGTTVVWTNHDDVDHTVTASDNAFSSPSIPTDGQFSHTFAAPGTYSYFCAIHPFMTAKVIVQ